MHNASIAEVPGKESTCKAKEGSVANAAALFPVCKVHSTIRSIFGTTKEESIDMHFLPSYCVPEHLHC